MKRKREILPKGRLEKTLAIIALICVVAAIVLIAWEPVRGLFRIEKINDIAEQIDRITKPSEGEDVSFATIVVKKNEMQIEGEDPEFLYEMTPEEIADYERFMAELPEEIILTPLGTIKIPSIDLHLGLWNEATVVPLRYGAGHKKDTALPGQEGNCVILGHRMITDGELFNRLGNVVVGDEILIASVSDEVCTYVVDTIHPAVSPADLWKYVEKDNGSGTQITLVTCTPTGVGTHRLLIIGHLKT